MQHGKAIFSDEIENDIGTLPKEPDNNSNSKAVATIILSTLLGNFCKGANIIHFSREIIFGQLLFDIWRFLSGHAAAYLWFRKGLFNWGPRQLMGDEDLYPSAQQI